jgi:hypothetical protein
MGFILKCTLKIVLRAALGSARHGLSAGPAASCRARLVLPLEGLAQLAVRRVATRWTGKKPIVDVLLIEA